MKTSKYSAIIGAKNSKDAGKIEKRKIDVEAETYQEAHKLALLHHCTLEEEVIKVYDKEYIYYTLKNGFKRFKKPEKK